MRSKAVIAGLLAALVLLLDAMAACPSLHEWFHPDAGKLDHQCAVTMFAHGKVDTASTEVPISVSLTFSGTVPSLVISVYRPAIEGLPSGPGPPVLLHNS